MHRALARLELQNALMTLLLAFCSMKLPEALKGCAYQNENLLRRKTPPIRGPLFLCVFTGKKRVFGSNLYDKWIYQKWKISLVCDIII